MYVKRTLDQVRKGPGPQELNVLYAQLLGVIVHADKIILFLSTTSITWKNQEVSLSTKRGFALILATGI